MIDNKVVFQCGTKWLWVEFVLFLCKICALTCGALASNIVVFLPSFNIPQLL